MREEGEGLRRREPEREVKKKGEAERYSHYIAEHTRTEGTRLHTRMFGTLSQDLQ